MARNVFNEMDDYVRKQAEIAKQNERHRKQSAEAGKRSRAKTAAAKQQKRNKK